MDFQLDEGLAEYGLNICRAKYVEIRLERRIRNDIMLVNGVMRDNNVTENLGFSIRVVDGGMGFYFSNIVSREEIKRGVERAEKMARIGSKKVGMSEERMEEGKYGIKAREAGMDEKMEYLHAMDAEVSDHSRIFSYTDEVVEKLYVNSEGSKIKSLIPRTYLYYLLTVSEEGKTEQMNREFGNAGGWDAVKEWKVEEFLRHDAGFLSDLIKHGEKPPERGDVIMGPQITGLIAHESCGHPFEADRILGREAAQAGKSYASPALLGEEFASECVSVADDPTIPGSYGYYLYDDEGIRAGKRMLIEKGIVREFLHSRETAYEMGCSSNAAARATYGKEPIVRMANTYFMPGDYNIEEMMEEVKEGVYMVTFMEWNIDDMRVNQKYVGEEAYIIKNGEVAGIARHPAIEISTFDFYRKVDAAGKNLEFYPATCGKGDPMQGIEVSTGGVDLRLRDMVIK